MAVAPQQPIKHRCYQCGQTFNYTPDGDSLVFLPRRCKQCEDRGSMVNWLLSKIKSF